MVKRNSQISHFYSIDDAIDCAINSRTVFIIANEKRKKSGGIGRYFTVFPSFKQFLKSKDNYPNCHEILIDHVNNKPNLAGRLVFDFDIKEKDIIPKDFKYQIENTISEVIDRFYHNVDCDRLIYVWSTSENPKKVSKHLTVKNLYFDNWIKMSRIFYQLFSIVWDATYSWIDSSDLVDVQVVKNKTSLRMVGCSKIDGYPLIFDDPSHTLTDSLIRIYFRNQRKEEQLVTDNNLNMELIDSVVYLPPEKIKNFAHRESQGRKPRVYQKYIYQLAFDMYQLINPNIFVKGKIDGNIVTILRTKSAPCLLSGKIHESENGYLIINRDENNIYSVLFACYRKCYKWNTTYLGFIDSEDNIILQSKYQTIVKKKKKKCNKYTTQ